MDVHIPFGFNYRNYFVYTPLGELNATLKYGSVGLNQKKKWRPSTRVTKITFTLAKPETYDNVWRPISEMLKLQKP